jgi:hypothetical protein
MKRFGEGIGRVEGEPPNDGPPWEREPVTEQNKKKPTRVRLKDGRTADYIRRGQMPQTHVVRYDDCGCIGTVREDQIKLMA